ncbi:Xaa-Pro peptidase family protein [Cytobacillus firmus]|uniref:M24 family metallopeptidase n=1 Tax=Cytobacillus firmus TaxID=1399 RepID=UPI001C96B0FA|nr:Xaa-Pro peptidase family protein [Cytobacillus firmus]MBY6052113.1 Xaa-Pro peptidase family protein [Cytobacillus firmus]
MISNPSRLIRSMQETELNGYDHLVVSSTYNLKYLLGANFDTGERMTVLLLSPGKNAKLFIHQMFSDQIPEFNGIEIVYYSDDMDPVKTLASHFANKERLGIDQTWLCSYFIDLLNHLPEINFEKSTIVEKLREIKDAQEIDTLRQSAKIADAVMYQILQLQHFPCTERNVAATIKSFFAENGVNELSFKPIIGFGKNSANPHHTISDQVCQLDQPILIDMGGLFKNYCSDITRTFYLGRRDQKFEDIYKIVHDTQLQVIDRIKPGISFSEIDLFVRSSFEKWGYEENFIHRTGHGIGLELHEGVSIHKNNHDLVVPGMAFSIEPGLYFPNQFGIRIEDIVVVTDEGIEVLNNSSKEVQYLELIGV